MAGNYSNRGGNDSGGGGGGYSNRSNSGGGGGYQQRGGGGGGRGGSGGGKSGNLPVDAQIQPNEIVGYASEVERGTWVQIHGTIKRITPTENGCVVNMYTSVGSKDKPAYGNYSVFFNKAAAEAVLDAQIAPDTTAVVMGFQTVISTTENNGKSFSGNTVRGKLIFVGKTWEKKAESGDNDGGGYDEDPAPRRSGGRGGRPTPNNDYDEN